MYIGIDVGGTKIAAGLVNNSGELLYKLEIKTDISKGFDGIVGEIAELVKNLIDSSEKFLPENVVESKILAIGVGIPGIADSAGNVVACVNLGWYNQPLREKLEHITGYRVFIDNDATVAAAAEFFVARDNRYRNAVMLTLGTGVGSGILINSKLHSGSHGIAAEVGHMIVGESDYDCNCGRNGCLETFSSSTAIIRYAKKLLTEPTENIPSSLKNYDINAINGEIIIREAKSGDILANKVIDRMSKYLAIGIINLVAVLDPEAIIIGGGLSRAGDFLIQKIIHEVEELKYFKAVPIPEISVALLQNDAGIIGAAMYSKSKI